MPGETFCAVAGSGEECTGQRVRRSCRPSIQVFAVRVHIPSVSSRSAEESDLTAAERYGSIVVCVGAQLRSSLFDVGSIGGVLEYTVPVSFGKSSVYRTVQATAEAVPGMKRTELLQGYRTKAIGADLTSVKCKGKWLPIGVVVDPINGLVLCVDHLDGEDAKP